MKYVKNIGGLSENSVIHLEKFLASPTSDWFVQNVSKWQYLYYKEIEGLQLVVKVYLHRKLRHRLAAWFHQSNADRYERACQALAGCGTPVPPQILILKTGRGVLPDRTLFAMGRVRGRMLKELLPEIAVDVQRIQILAPKIAELFKDLRRARLFHRDLNTKNILVTEDNEVTLIDLDYTRRHLGRDATFLKKHHRDLNTFASTCGPAKALADAVLSLANPQKNLCG